MLRSLVGSEMCIRDRAWDKVLDLMPEGPTVAACINAVKFEMWVDEKLDGRNECQCKLRFNPDQDCFVHEMALELFPDLYKAVRQHNGGDNSPYVLADRLRQGLIRSQLQRHTHRLDEPHEASERTQVAFALLEFLRLYHQEAAKESFTDQTVSWASPEQVSRCFDMLTQKKVNCVHVAGHHGFVEYNLATALVRESGKLHEFDGDALAACLSELPNVQTQELTTVRDYPHQAAAVAIRRFICNKLFRELTLNKHMFEQLVEQLRQTLLDMAGPTAEAPERLEGISLCALLETCKFALETTQLPEERDDPRRRPPALVWAENRRRLQLVNGFVGSPPGSISSDRRHEFEEPGGLLDPQLGGISAQVCQLLRRSENVCEFVVRLCEPEHAVPSMNLADDPSSIETLGVAQRDQHLAAVPHLLASCTKLAADMRAAGRIQAAARLDQVGSGKAYVGASVEYLKKLEEDITNIKSTFGRTRSM
eukprot:TRINITY_DN16624_c0_g2_i2.p1 TRINITY_DN16624_c0_g2~~TRINITY_DN16624_c0_g2_i2.p1  ORF type:complete len:480 (+),score=129.08 TRINITY_DN16624_c0_g2_i2:157-1596(+)